MKQNNQKLAQEWFEIGDNELGFAKAGFEELKSFYPQICFQCQQAVEKYLKGFLIYHRKSFPKIHDLTQLTKLCSKIDKRFLKFLKETDILGQYYLTSRYPLEYRPAGKFEAKQALQIAEKIIYFIRNEVSKK
ncbi:MAG: HEPN domain-containing protein [Patescibacteria group bacterium]|nr:HEPN domain-containing protein [Patescibacteria group bacterium]